MITTAGGWVGSWIQSRRTRAQNRADDATASEKFASAAKTLIEPLRQEVVALRIGSEAQQATIDKQQRKIVYLTHGVGVLTRQITRAGLQPEWVYSDNEDGSSGRIVVDDAGDPDRSGSDGDA